MGRECGARVWGDLAVVNFYCGGNLIKRRYIFNPWKISTRRLLKLRLHLLTSTTRFKEKPNFKRVLLLLSGEKTELDNIKDYLTALFVVGTMEQTGQSASSSSSKGVSPRSSVRQAEARSARSLDGAALETEVEVIVDQPKEIGGGRRTSTSSSHSVASEGPRRVEKSALSPMDILSVWTHHSNTMRRRREQLWGTGWRPLIQYKGYKRPRAVETWIYFDDKKAEWYGIAVDGSTIRVNESRLNILRDDYLALKDSVKEEYYFLNETVINILEFCGGRELAEIMKLWGAVINPISDYIVADFRCSSCGKTRPLHLANARMILRMFPPERRLCSQIGLQCGQSHTEQGYDAPIKLQEKMYGLEDQQQTAQAEKSNLFQSFGHSDSVGRGTDNLVFNKDFIKEEGIEVEGNTLAVLKAMGKQGISVKPYDGTGGCAALKVWGESVKRHLRLFNIKEGIDQVTVAACCLEGKAKDWWDNVVLTEQSEEIKNVEQLLDALRVHFRPLNEDIRLSLQWKNLQQVGDINAYRQAVYQLKAQFPFGEVAEFSLAYHGLKKELRAPILSELWKMNVRFLPLSQLFDLAAQAEATTPISLFPRLTERLRQEDRSKRSNWNNWSGPSWSGNGRYQGSGYNKVTQGWPPAYRAHPSQQPIIVDSPQVVEQRLVSKKKGDKTDEQKEWMKKRPCWICDKAGHLIRDCNKRKPSGCPRCGKDHQLRVCPARPKASVAGVSIINGHTETDLFHHIDNLLHETAGELLRYRINVNNKESVVMVDTGAQLSLVSKEEAIRLGLEWNSAKTRQDVVTADGKALTVVGEAKVELEHGGRKMKELMFVVHPLRHPLILGLPWIRKHQPTFDWEDLTMTLSTGETWLAEGVTTQMRGVRVRRLGKADGSNQLEEKYLVALSSDETGREVDQLDATKLEFSVGEFIKPVLEEFRDIFTPLSGIPPEDRIQHNIELIKGAKPVMKRPYRLAESQAKEVERQILNALNEGWIQPSFSPWGTAIFVVAKKNGEWRMCVDYRDLNALTEQDAYPLPRIDDILHKVAKATVFSTLDLQSGYHQIQIREEDRQKTAFRLASAVRGSSHYEWRVMPFGLKNAPPTFQRYMSLILKGCVGFCEVYMDDIIVYSQTEEDHLQHVRTVFKTLREAELKVKYEKCVFGQRKVEFLGHVLEGGKIWMRPAKQVVINDWHEPLKTAKEVRQFLGLASYYRGYVKNFATVAAPLIALTRKRASICWTWEVEQAFKALKLALSQQVGRACWDSLLPTRVTTDASGVGLGAVLEQQHGEDWETVAMWSRALNPCQRNYSILDKEWLAILEAVTRVWKHWLVGHSFTIHTDHAPLVQILTKKAEELTPRQLRWLERLEPFSFSIKFIRGQENVVADALSREVVPQESAVNAIEIVDQRQTHFGYDDIIESVTADDFYREILEDEMLQQQLEVEARDGLLFTGDGKLCVPNNKTVRFQLVLEHHDQKFAGHWSVDKTLAQLKQCYYWPTMAQEVKEVVETCDVCQRSQFQRKTDRAPIRFIEAQYPWEVVTVDFVSGFAPTRRKHTAICVICDRFSRMMHAEPCHDHATAKDTARILIRRLFAPHGCPRVLLSDRGTQFDSELWHHFWNMMGTRVHLATTHHPQSNGLTERMNRTLIGLIRKVTQGRKHEWDEALPLLEFAYNRTPNSTTGVPPFEAQQGYLPSVPSSLLIAAQNQTFKTASVGQFVSKIRQTYQDIHRLICETEAKNQEQTRLREDSRRRRRDYQVGR